MDVLVNRNFVCMQAGGRVGGGGPAPAEEAARVCLVRGARALGEQRASRSLQAASFSQTAQEVVGFTLSLSAQDTCRPVTHQSLACRSRG